jgi:hypothetical protein
MENSFLISDGWNDCRRPASRIWMQTGTARRITMGSFATEKWKNRAFLVASCCGCEDLQIHNQEWFLERDRAKVIVSVSKSLDHQPRLND